jgi:hypothetical protein
MGRVNEPGLQPTAPAKPGLIGRAARKDVDRRSGKDRRSADVEPPDKRERRTTVESRQPDVAEIEMSDSAWAELNRQLPKTK